MSYDKTRIRCVLAAAVASAVAAMPAGATPGSGVTGSNAVRSGPAAIRTVYVGAGLLLKVEDDKQPVNIFSVTNSFAPGGYSGWHTHSGPGFVTVVQGTLTIEEEEGCFVDYPQGSVLFEGGPTKIHNALNRTSGTVVIHAVFFLPDGVPSRIDAPVTPSDGDCDSH